MFAMHYQSMIAPYTPPYTRQWKIETCSRTTANKQCSLYAVVFSYAVRARCLNEQRDELKAYIDAV